MALTENTFTQEEFQSALDANPELVNTVKTTLSEKKFVVQDEAEHKTFLENHENVIATRLTNKHAETIEKDVKELTGIDKIDANEKYYDYFKRATSTKLSKVNELETEIQTLKSGHNPSEADKKRIKELEDLVETTKNDFTGKLTEKEKEIFSFKVGGVIDAETATISSKFRKDLDKDLLDIAKGQIVADIKKRSQLDENGVVIIIGEDGQPELNQKTMKSKTAVEELNEKFAKFIEPKKVVTGTGTSGSGGDDDNKDFTGFPSEVDTKMKATEFLKKKGIVYGSEEWDKIWKENVDGKIVKLR